MPARHRVALLFFVLACALQPASVLAQQGPAQGAVERDGARDFDFEFGVWTTRVERLRNPLSGSTNWVRYEGATVVRDALGGRANLAELAIEGPEGRIEGVSLRLYNPQSRQWTLNYANVADGQLTQALTGAFRNGRGEFYGQDTLNGRAIFVRFVISDITPNSARFEQAFSADGGVTWEVNWIATDTRR